jgi:hypothetical protein
LDQDDEVYLSVSAGNSFRETSKTKMKYSEFLGKIGQPQQVPVTLKDSRNELILKQLGEEIVEPTFLAEYSELENVELIQGQIFVNPAHYDYQEQFLCTLDGYSQVKLISHIYRQEVYAGKD